MTGKPNKTEHKRLMDLALQHVLLRERDIQLAGISRTTIGRAVASGELERLSPGVYRHPESSWDENLNISEVSARVPHAVIALISALHFHLIGSHQAHSVWILLRNNAVAPRISYPPIEVIKSGVDAAFENGVESHQLNDITVHITSPARTVVDCFKYRNRVGLEVCIEALKDVLQQKKTTPAEIMELAKMQRVTKVIQPYLEAII